MTTLIQNVVAEAVRTQPWYKRNANTIVAGIGAVTAVLAFLVTLELPVPEVVTGAVPTVIAFLTAVAVKLTRNGVQPSTAQKLEDTDAAHGIEPAVVSTYAGGSSVPDVSPSQSGLPVWDMPVTADYGTDDYVGQHRLT